MVGFLITNNGPHPADKWAEIMVNDVLGLIQIDDNSDSDEARAARKAKRDLGPKLFDVFEAAVQRVQEHECDACKRGTTTADPLDPKPHTPQVVTDFDALMATTPFADHFATPAAKAAVLNIFHQRFASVMNVERCWASNEGAQ